MNKDLIRFLLFDLRPRPGMYLSAYKLSFLDIYLTGVELTCRHLDKNGDYADSFFGKNGFLQWSWRKYNLGQPSFRLYHYIDLAKGNEKDGLDLFFKDLEVFQQENSS